MKNIFIIFIVLTLFFISSCNQSKKEITQWEYKITSISDLNFEKEMNIIGSNRWELVFARRSMVSRNEYSYEMIFKRPLLVMWGGENEAEDLIKKIEEKDIKSKFLMAMSDMKSIGTAIEAYIADMIYAPKIESYSELNANWFVPFYIKTIPLKDPWGNSFYYKHGSGDKADIYWIGCAGSDGIFEGFDQKGDYLDLDGKDIIFSSGIFTYSPRTK